MNLKSKYLELLKKTLLNEIYLENELRIYLLANRNLFTKGLLGFKKVDFEKLHHVDQYFPELWKDFKKGREIGKLLEVNTQHLVYSHTMIGRRRLENIQYCLEVIVEEQILGDVMECGVWKGGASIFMTAVLEELGEQNRKVWLADSFEGVPPSSHEKDVSVDLSKVAYPGLAISQENVEALFKKYDLLNDNVRFLKGWFKDSLPNAPIEKLSLLRLDGDLYESTIDALDALYHKVAPGGFVIIDDYKALIQCEEAVHDFRKKENISDTIHEIDHEAIFWRKGC